MKKEEPVPEAPKEIEPVMEIDYLKQVIRRLDNLQKVLDLVYKDGNLLEDIQISVRAVEQALHLSRAKATETAKDMRENINGVKDAVATKVDEVGMAIDDHTVIVKSPKQSILEKIARWAKGGKNERHNF